MKKKLLILAVVVSLLTMGGASIASAQTWNTGFQVQNLGTAEAHISITYYNQDGSVNGTPVNDTIPTGQSKTYYPIHPTGTFNGSVVIASDQPVAAIANNLGSAPGFGASYSGASSGALKVTLPLIMHYYGGNHGWYTNFNVQNVGSADANITMKYYAVGSAVPAFQKTDTIKPGAAHTYDQSLMDSDFGGATVPWVGSCVIESTNSQPIVAVCQELNKISGGLMAYNGFTAGSSTVAIPLVMANNNGWGTGVQVANVGAAATDVTITYTALVGTAPAPDTKTIQPNSSYTWLTTAAGKFVGSATLTAAGGGQIVAIVNEVNYSAGGTNAQSMSYNGVNPDSATNKISLPLIMYHNGSSWWTTGLQVMNVGTTATTINLTYSGSTVTRGPINLNPGQSYNWIENGDVGSSYVGSVTVTAASGGKIAAIVNEVTYKVPAPSGEHSLCYNGFNY